jgi:hypothetical protein
MATFDLNIGGETKSLILISEGNYSSEYLLRESDKEYRMKIRHTKEKPTNGGVALDRHNVDLTVRTYPTDANPLGSTDNAYVVIRSNPNSNGSGSADLGVSLSEVVTNHATELVAWVSTL